MWIDPLSEFSLMSSKSILSKRSSASKEIVLTSWSQACHAPLLLVKCWLSMSSTKPWILSSVLSSFRISSSTPKNRPNNSLTAKFDNLSMSTCRVVDVIPDTDSISFTDESSTSFQSLPRNRSNMLLLGWPAVYRKRICPPI